MKHSFINLHLKGLVPYEPEMVQLADGDVIACRTWPCWGTNIKCGKGTDVSYGPWVDRQRWVILIVHVRGRVQNRLFCVGCQYTVKINIRGKKITCPGARDKLNFRQDKHIFSPNVRRASKKFYALYFSLTRTSYLVIGQVKILMYLPGGQVKFFRFFYP